VAWRANILNMSKELLGRMVACKLRDRIDIGMIVDKQASGVEKATYYCVEWYGDTAVKHAYYPLSSIMFFLDDYENYKKEIGS
jgi:hypothetical protein